MSVQVVEVGDVVNPAVLIEDYHNFFADAFDVHHAPAYEVLDSAAYLGRATPFVGTHPRRLAFDPHKPRAAYRAVGHECHRLCVGLSAVGVDTGYLGYYLASFFDIKHVVLVNVEGAHNVGVVERRTLHDGAR